jgi:hypothetical protein
MKIIKCPFKSRKRSLIAEQNNGVLPIKQNLRLIPVSNFSHVNYNSKCDTNDIYDSNNVST